MKLLFLLLFGLAFTNTPCFAKIGPLEQKVDEIKQATQFYESESYSPVEPDLKWEFYSLSESQLKVIESVNREAKETGYQFDLNWIRKNVVDGPFDQGSQEFFKTHLPETFIQLANRDPAAFFELRGLWNYVMNDQKSMFSPAAREKVLTDYLETLTTLSMPEKAKKVVALVSQLNLFSSLTYSAYAEHPLYFATIDKFIAKNLENKYAYLFYAVVLSTHSGSLKYQETADWRKTPEYAAFVTRVNNAMIGQRIPAPWIKKIDRVLDMDRYQHRNAGNWLGILFGGYGGELEPSERANYFDILAEYIKLEENRVNPCNGWLRFQAKVRQVVRRLNP